MLTVRITELAKNILKRAVKCNFGSIRTNIYILFEVQKKKLAVEIYTRADSFHRYENIVQINASEILQQSQAFFGLKSYI